jgi:hypothetical protein
MLASGPLAIAEARVVRNLADWVKLAIRNGRSDSMGGLTANGTCLY